MAKHDDISSTEKLLDLIRKKNGSKENRTDIDTSSPIAPSFFKKSFSKIFSFKRKYTVAVDIDVDDIKLVKIVQSSEKKYELVDYAKIPFQTGQSKAGPEFQRFLKSTLSKFCGHSDQLAIWSAISSANVETRYLKIPKVPKKQLANAAYWTFKKDVPFEDTKDVFDFEVLGETVVDGARKIEIMAYCSPRREIEGIKRIFSKSGYPLTGISIVPFAIQNLLKTGWLGAGSENVCSLFIGRDWSRIAIFSEGNLILSRDIKAGIKSMIETIKAEIDRIHTGGDGFSTEMKVDADFGLHDGGSSAENDHAQNLFFQFIHNLSEANEDSVLDYKDDDIFNMILPAIDRVVRQVERTIKHYSLNFENKGVSKVFISGLLSAHQRIVDYIADQLGLSIQTVDPFSPGMFVSTNLSIPESELERGAFVPSVGMALSNNDITPNFIYTYKDKDQQAIKLGVKRLTKVICLIVVSISIGISYWQINQLNQKKRTISQLQGQLDKYSPLVDQNMIVQMVAKTEQKRKRLEAVGEKYLSLAVVGEISDLTPSNIRLTSMTIELGKPGAFNQRTQNSQTDKYLICEGIISGEPVMLESALAEYIIKLQNSPMFGQVAVNKKDIKYLKTKKVFRFTIRMELV